MKLLSLLKRESLKYNSISNLPIGVWDAIHESRDVTLLAAKKKKKYNTEKLLNAWENILDEYLKKFGMSEESKNSFEARKRAAIYKAKYIIENKRHYLTHAQIELENINFNKRYKSVDLDESLAVLTKHYGIKMTPINTTVSEYFTYIKTAINGRSKSR